MPHQPYPTLDIECVKTLIDIGRRGAIREEIRDFAKCGYELGGAVLKATVGEPDDVIVGSDITRVGVEAPAEPSTEQLEECYDYLTAALPTLDNYAAEADSTEAISPVLASLLMQLAIEALNFFLNKRKGG